MIGVGIGPMSIATRGAGGGAALAFPEDSLTLTATLPKDTALNSSVDKANPSVWACDFTGLDLASDGYIWDCGGSGSGSYVGVRDGYLIVRAFDGTNPGAPLPGGTWSAETAYLYSDVPSGDGTLVWHIDNELGTARAWWNGEELPRNGQGAATFPRVDIGGADETCFLGTAGGAIPNGEVAAGTALATYATASDLRYYEDQTIAMGDFRPIDLFGPGDIGFILDPAASALKSDGSGGYTPATTAGDEIIRTVSQAPSGENFDKPGAAPSGLIYGMDGARPYFQGLSTGSALEVDGLTIPNCGANGRTIVVGMRYGDGNTGGFLVAGSSKALDSLSSGRLRGKLITNEGSVDVSPVTMPAVAEKYVLTSTTDFATGLTHSVSAPDEGLSSSSSLTGHTADTSGVSWRLNAATSAGAGSTDAQFFYVFMIDRPLSDEDTAALVDYAAERAGISADVAPAAITYTAETGPSSAVLEELTSPQTQALTADAGQTGTILVVQTGISYDTPVTATLNSVQMTEVASIQTRYPATRQTSRTTTFYSDETSGTLSISSEYDRDFTVKSYVVKVAGDQIRSWSAADVRNVAIPDSSGVPVALNGTAHGDNNLLVALQHGDFNQDLSGASWELVGQQNSNALDLRVNALFAEAAGTVDASWTSTTGRDFLGCQVIAFSPDAAPTIGVNEPTVYGYIYPLNVARTSADVTVTGTYRNAPFGGIEFRVVEADGTEVVTWAAATVDSGARTFTGTASITATAEELFFEARFAGATSVTWRQGSPWYIGVHVFWNGQSNQARFSGGSQIQDEPAIATKALLYEVDDKRFTWDVGDGMAAFLNEVRRGGEMPILCVMEAVGGSKLVEFLPGTEFYQRTEDAIARFKFSFDAMGYHQGEGDCTNVSSGGQDEIDYFTGQESIRDGVAALCGRLPSEMTLMIQALGWAQGENVIQTPDQWAGFKNMQKAYGGTITNAVFASTDDDMVLNENFHNYPRGYGRRGLRLGYHYRHLLGYETTSGLFNIGSTAAVNGTTTTVTLDYTDTAGATDFTVGTLTHFDGIGYPGVGSTSDVQGFEVTDDDWVTAYACTGVRTDANTITLTHADLGTAARKLRYNWSTNGNTGGFVLDNGPLAAPLTFEGSLSVTPA